MSFRHVSQILCMAFYRRWFFILLVLALGCGLSSAAGSRKEERDYAAAVAAFNDGMNDRAVTAFAQFADNYPASSHLPQAVLLRAQAEFKQGKFAEAVARLTDTNNLAQAGILADEYFYWTGEAQFQETNYPAAAETWVALAQKFPASRLRLQAVVQAASAFTELAEWQKIVALLAATNGVFQGLAQLEPENELVVRGELLLAQARFALKDFPGASAILKPLLELPAIKPELGRQCALLFYQVKLAADETDAALAVTTNLLQIARLEGNANWIAGGVAMQADALEKLGRGNEAMAVYQENLTNAPADWQRTAILKIARLAIAQKQFPVAASALEKLLAQFPDSPSADIALLTLGELQLRDYAAQPAATNLLAAAQRRFDQFIGTFTNSPLAGKAHLDRGWCGWLAAKRAENSDDLKTATQKYSESFEDFKTAAQKIAALQLPPSEDLLVAWFKMGDAQFAQTNFAGALENYRAVLDGLKISPEAGAALEEPAWYQMLRVSLALNDVAGASNAFARISQKSSAAGLAQSSALLYGENVANPRGARMLYETLASRLSGSPLQPQVALAVARTYEREQNWPAAITNYENWLKDFPTNALQPQVVYALAQANFQSVNEMNAFQVFTNFVARFPTDTNAPSAQWWVADHFFRAGDWVNAERNYKYIFQNPDWRNSPLVWQAQMMAGRAALDRLGYPDAIGYFTSLAGDTNCPVELAVPARFAYGSTLMLMNSTETNNPLANLQAATNVFGQIAQANPTNEWGQQAMLEAGKCDLQMNNFDAVTNVCAQVFNSPFAGISARSQAQIGFGIALEKKAALASGGGADELRQLALQNYADVLYGKNLRDDEQPDSFWQKKAGLQSAALAEAFANYEVATNVYSRLEKLFPQAKDALEKKIAAVQVRLTPGKN